MYSIVQISASTDPDLANMLSVSQWC